MEISLNNSINFLDQWKPLKMVGSGSTCDVILVQDKTTQCKKVVKLFKATVKPRIAEAEGLLMTSLNHPRILSASGYFPKVSLPGGAEGTSGVPAIEMDFVANGDLLDFIQSFDSFPEAIAKSYFLQLVDALGYLHDKGISHLDIKPDNILVDENYNLKLADLGVSAQIPKEWMIKGVVGTATYHAPEIHARRPYSPYQADLFALGMTLFTMVTGSMPFQSAKSDDQIYKLITEKNFEEFWQIHEDLAASKNITLSKSFKSLIESMLSAEVSQRLTLEQIKKHAWLEETLPSSEKLFRVISSVLTKQKSGEGVRAVNFDSEFLGANNCS